ncbi:MAG: tRNA lysidine(34) synthetase TilS [Clostridia bacterium]
MQDKILKEKNNIEEYLNSDKKLQEFEKDVLNIIIENKLIENGDKIVVAVSGGPDSMCLLNILYELQPIFSKEHNIDYKMVVAHVNHGIREESKQEKTYVENFCGNINIPFFYLEENVPKLSKKLKLSEETCGRKVRYEFFEKILLETNSNKIAVAHNLDDNVETIILNIIRGCGLKGLIGMDYIFKNIIRPLLTLEKSKILEYNILKNLNPCFDKTNEQEIYIRNKLRLKLIPTLKSEYNSNILKNITRMKNILKLDEDFLSKYTNNIVDECIIDESIKDNKSIDKIYFRFDNILKEHSAIKMRAIRKIIEYKMCNLDGIENIHVIDILKLLEKNIKGKKYIIGNKFTIKITEKNIAIIY